MLQPIGILPRLCYGLLQYINKKKTQLAYYIGQQTCNPRLYMTCQTLITARVLLSHLEDLDLIPGMGLSLDTILMKGDLDFCLNISGSAFADKHPKLAIVAIPQALLTLST